MEITESSLCLKGDGGWGRVREFLVLSIILREITESSICRKGDMGRGIVRECVKLLGDSQAARR